jgi:hypothetical protein
MIEDGDCGAIGGLKIEVFEENLPQLHFVKKSYVARPGLEPVPPRWEASDRPPELWRSPS